jgi:hypothetical protein
LLGSRWLWRCLKPVLTMGRGKPDEVRSGSKPYRLDGGMI